MSDLRRLRQNCSRPTKFVYVPLWTHVYNYDPDAEILDSILRRGGETKEGLTYRTSVIRESVFHRQQVPSLSIDIKGIRPFLRINAQAVSVLILLSAFPQPVEFPIPSEEGQIANQNIIDQSDL